MPITTAYVPETFQGDGVTNAFAITFPYQLSTDLVVQTTVVATGVITTLTLGTDYSVTPASNSPAATGTVTLLLGALPVGTDITLSRNVPQTQLTTWVPNDPNPSTAIMNAVDKLTMEVQQFYYLYGGRSWYLRPTDVDGSGAFDARGNRGTNLGSPTTGTDAVNVNYLQQYVASVILTGSTTVAPVFTFTGDGTTTSFNLPGVTISYAAGFQVSVDGLIQTPNSDYTIIFGSPSTISFTSAPPSGTAIVIVPRGFAAPGPGGSATAATFLRGDGVYTNALIGAGGTPSINSDATQLFGAGQTGADAAIRVTSDSTHVAYYRFGVSGSGNVFNAALGYSAVNASIGHYSQSAPYGALSQFYDNGNVYLGNSLFVNYGGFVGIGTTSPAFTLDVVGNVNITGNYTGNASGALITSGQVLPQFLASNVPTASTFLRGDGVWATPAGGGGSGGFNTTTTATFVVAAVNSSQTVSVASTTGLNIGNYIYINDVSHTMIGEVTNIVSLNLTVQTSQIVGGIAGDTMASGAAVSLNVYPSFNAIKVADGTHGASNATQIVFSGSIPPNQRLNVTSYIATTGGGTWDVFSYLDASGNAYDSIALGAYNAGSPYSAWLGSAGSGVLQWNSGIASIGNLNAGLITANTGTASATTFLRGDNSWSGITPAPIVATNSPNVGQVLTYANSGQFTWANAGAGGLPSGGTTALFLRGDSTWTNALAGPFLAGSSLSPVGNYGIQLVFGTGLSFYPASGSTHYGNINAVDGGSTSTSVPIIFSSPIAIGANSSMDSVQAGNQVESLIAAGIVRGSGIRTTHGPWQLTYTPGATSGAITFDLVNGAYQRITPTGAITMTLADTTPAPYLGLYKFASVLTLEIIGTVTMTWDASITWAGGASAPTLTSGTNILRFIKRQGVSGWIGYVENVSSGSYTDAQARTAVLQSAYLVGTSTVQVSVSAGTSASFSIPAGGVGTTQLANSAVTIAKISATGTASSTTYLRGDGTWSTPSASSGQAAIQFQFNGSNEDSAGAINLFNIITQQTSAAPNVTSTPIGGTHPYTVYLPYLTYQIAGAAIGTFNTINFPSGSAISGGVLNVAGSGGGGSFSPATTYTWTAPQTGMTFTNTYASFGSSTVAGGFASQSGDSNGDFGSNSTGIYVHINNNASAATQHDMRTATFWQTLNNPGAGSMPIESFFDVKGNCNASGFEIGFSQIIASRQLNKPSPGGSEDAIWFVSGSPDHQYSTAPDPQGIVHTWTAGWVRIGEVNYSNAWADFGLIETRSAPRAVIGMEFFPDGTVGGNPGFAARRSYHAQWAIGIGAAGPDYTGFYPQNHIGIFMDANGIAPGGYGVRLRGANGTFNGSSASANAPGALIKMSDTAQTGIDFAGSTGDSTALTATSTGAAVIQMLDGQSIRIGTSFWLRASGTNLQYSTNGASWTNFTLP